MDILKRNVFWLVLAVVLLLTAGFYMLKVSPLRSEVADLSAKFDEHTKRFVGEFVKDGKIVPGKVRSKNEIAAEKKYRGDLEAEVKSVKRKLVEKQFDLSKADFDPAPPPATDPVAFREWVEARYRERDEATEKNGLALPDEDSNPFSRGDYNTTVIFASTDEEQQIVLKRFYITREVLEALSKVKVDVTEMVPIKEDLPNSAEKVVTVSRGIERLLSLQFMRPEDLARGRQATSSGRDPQKMPDAPSMTRGKPYREHIFVLKVLGHFSALPLAVQALDQIEDFVLVVKRIDVSPVSPDDSSSSRRGGGRAAKAKKDATLENTRSKEAVVSAVFECSVLEYDFDAAGRRSK